MSSSHVGCTITVGVLRSMSVHLSLAAEKSGSEGVKILELLDSLVRKSDMNVFIFGPLKNWAIDEGILLAFTSKWCSEKLTAPDGMLH